MAKLLKVLPSMVRLPNGNEVEFQSLQPAEQIQLQLQIAKNISFQMGHYYTNHPEEWNNFLQVMSE